MESKLKISKNRKGKYKGEEHVNYGKPLPDSVKMKIAEKNKINSSGEKNGMFGKSQYNIWMEKYGKEEADKRLNNWRNKISNIQSGKITSEETKNKQRISALKRKRYKCPHCNKEYDSGNFKQHIKSLERKKLVDSYWVLETLRDKEII
jgi:hypothetical protein